MRGAVEEVLSVSLTGSALLENPLLNKGSAFTEEERWELGLAGLLPPHVSTLDQQIARSYGNFKRKENDLERYVFLTSLRDRNETLFYALVQTHIGEMMPVIYTPIVGAGCQNFSRIWRRPRGLYISYDDRDRIPALLDNTGGRRVDVIVVTDGERILGLGDLGIGGMDIPVGKLSLYTLCAGIHPGATLPIVLDAGTDNPELLEDPLYLGLRRKRIRGADYDGFVEAFVAAVARRFPNALLQWEDFAKGNAWRLLEKYRDRLCTFNDDIQGTGAVTLAGLLSAMAATGGRLRDQKIVMLGAGSAATGIADQITARMRTEGLSPQEAASRIWLVDSRGLVCDARADLEPFKRRYARPATGGGLTLADVVREVRPTVLIGLAAQPGAFTEQIVRGMAASAERPVIFPLSNPTSKCEATPADILRWTDGRAVVATGSPFADVQVGRESVRIGQCNNAYIFPGVGLGVTACGARRVTDGMFLAAAGALADLSPARADPRAPLFPPLDRIREVSLRVAAAVAEEAQAAGLADAIPPAELSERLQARMWRPVYPRYRRAGGPRYGVPAA